GIDPEPMLEYVRGKLTERKLRLLTYACCHRLWRLLEEPYKKALKANLAYAEVLVSVEELSRAWSRANRFWHAVTHQHRGSSPSYHAGAAVVNGCSAELPSDQPENARGFLCHLRTVRALSRAQALDGNEPDANERREQAILVRHIIGNPFRPSPVRLSWPST